MIVGACHLSCYRRVQIETSSSFDLRRDGRPTIEHVNDEANGRSRLELLFVPMSDSSERGCDNGECEVNVLAIAVAVPIAVLVTVVIVVVMIVPRVREKVFPFVRRK